MKYLQIILLCLIGLQLSAADKIGVTCKNFTGSSLEFEKGKVNSYEDGYSGTTVEFAVGTNGGIVKYSGNVNRTDAVEMLAGSKDGFISYYKAFQDVHKIYTLYSSFPMALSIVEIQTQLYSGHPQVRTFIGSCK